MTTSDQSFRAAIDEFQRTGPSGLYHRIVQVAYLKAREEGTPSWAWLEETISRFKRAVETSSFAASASYARAIAHYGVVQGSSLRDCLGDLDPHHPGYANNILAKVAEVNRRQASQARRLSGIRSEGSRWDDTHVTLRAVLSVIDLAQQGDQKAMRELALIQDAVRLPLTT